MPFAKEADSDEQQPGVFEICFASGVARQYSRRGEGYMGKIQHDVYSDRDIAVALVAENAEDAAKMLYRIGIRWLTPGTVQDKDGAVIAHLTNVMGGETDWFILPHDFSVAVARSLIEKKVAGNLPHFVDEGFSKMISWLVEMEELRDGMNY
jgi:hypothetical protein